jgi:C4-type Zn-finger protein
MATVRECPLCGGTMQLSEMKSTTPIPGASKPTVQTSREWICPECDYFEEAGNEED